MKNTNVSVIILSAGRSGRSKYPKALLKFDSKFSFLEQLITVYTDLKLNQIAVVLNHDLEVETSMQLFPFTKNSNIIQVVNSHPERGRFTSIRLGANMIDHKSPAFIQNIDNPFTTPELIESMIARLHRGTYVAPVCNGKKGHPVLLSTEILDIIRKTKEADSDLRKILKYHNCVEFETDDSRIHANINTEEEYKKYFMQEEMQTI